MAIASDTGISNSDHITDSNTPSFTGSGTAGDTIEVFANSTLIARGLIPTGGTYTVTPTSPLLDGTYTITADQADGLNQHSSMSAAMTPNLKIDTLAPTVSITAVSPNPRNTAVSSLAITFSEPVSNFTLANLQLSNDGGSNQLATAGAQLTSSDSIHWTLSNLASVTGTNGNFALTLLPAGITDTAGNALAAGASSTWLTDLSPPTSKVSPLPQVQTSLSFAVTATGTDTPVGPGIPVSGISSFDLYVSTNGSPFVLWTTVPASNPTATFTGVSNTTYAFHSIAHDNAGNVETKSATLIEASTFVPDLTPPTAQITSDNFTAGGTFTLNYSGTAPGGSGVKTFSLFVQVDGGAVQPIGQFAAGMPTGGVYSGQTTYQGLTDGVQHTYIFSIQATSGPNITGALQATAPVVATFAVPSSPQVTAFSVEKGLAERSYVRYVDVTFNQAVSGLTLDTAHVTLKQFNLAGTTQLSTVNLAGKINLVDHVMELDFGAAGLGVPLTPRPAMATTN